MNLYVCSTPYHIFLSLVYLFLNEEKGILYLTTHDNQTEKVFKKINEKLKGMEKVEKVILRKRSRKMEILKIEKIFDFLDYLKHFKSINDVLKLYNFSWNPYSLYTPSNYFYKKIHKAIFVEEGSNLYSFKKPSKIKLFIKKYIYNVSMDFFNDDKLEKILVQFPEKYPEHLQKKIEGFSTNELLNKLSEKDKHKIINVFLPIGYGERLLTFNNKNNLIILTQPLSEDGYTTEENKVQLYKDIIENYKGSYDIILKKHPREKTTYHFDNVLELDGFFPSEIFNMLGIKFKKAIGICTSAIHNINADEKLNTDEDFLNRRKH